MTHNVFFYEKKDLCLCSMILKITGCAQCS